MAIRVKPLEFNEHGKAGVYRVSPTYGQGPKAFSLAYGNRGIGYFDDEASAKAAAQQHHHDQTMASIEVDPA